jgi:hypothetical protein
MRRRAFLAAAGAVFAGAAFSAGAQTPVATPTLPPPPNPPLVPIAPPAPVAPPPELEAIRSVIVGRRGLTIRVASHGCTRRADFAFFVERKAGVTTLAFGRKRIETCGRGRAGETALDFSFKDLGVDPDEPVVVLNPLLSAKWRGRR